MVEKCGPDEETCPPATALRFQGAASEMMIGNFESERTVHCLFRSVPVLIRNPSMILLSRILLSPGPRATRGVRAIMVSPIQAARDFENSAHGFHSLRETMSTDFLDFDSTVEAANKQDVIHWNSRIPVEYFPKDSRLSRRFVHHSLSSTPRGAELIMAVSSWHVVNFYILYIQLSRVVPFRGSGERQIAVGSTAEQGSRTLARDSRERDTPRVQSAESISCHCLKCSRQSENSFLI